MSYILNKTTGQILITLQDGTADGPDINPGANVSDLDLFGKNYPYYGQYIDENFVKLLQNFANVTPPSAPLEGELWYDISSTANYVLRVYDGTSWLPVTPVWVANAAPVTTQVGAQWWDATNYQLNMYNGSGWTTVGPAFKAPDGISGAIVEDVMDTTGATHTIIKFYTNNNVIAISSYDQAFTLSPANPVTGFSLISPGFTLAAENNNLIYGTAVNAQQLGNIAAVNYARRDIDSLFYGNISLGGGELSLQSSSGNGVLTNSVLGGGFALIANVSGNPLTLLGINGVSGEVTTYQNPITSLGVVTKQYSDTSIAIAVAPLAPMNSPILTGTPTAPNVAFNTNTAQIASMSSVQSAITYGNTAPWMGSHRTISTAIPQTGAGTPGDFWFQI